MSDREMNLHGMTAAGGWMLRIWETSPKETAAAAAAPSVTAADSAAPAASPVPRIPPLPFSSPSHSLPLLSQTPAPAAAAGRQQESEQALRTPQPSVCNQNQQHHQLHHYHHIFPPFSIFSSIPQPLDLIPVPLTLLLPPSPLPLPLPLPLPPPPHSPEASEGERGGGAGESAEIFPRRREGLEEAERLEAEKMDRGTGFE
ncbi:unnamed protein product [Closterium sp. NIES-54]